MSNKQKEEIRLSDHFTFGRLLRFTYPSIIMMVFTSIYGVVDGLFVSNFTGATPFAAINLIMPFLNIFCTIGFMVGTGGSALVAKTMGEGDRKRANEIFSMLTYFLMIMGVLMCIIGQVTLEKVAVLLGATDEMLPYCVQYGRIMLLAIPAFMLQNQFQSFMITAEKPKFGLVITVAAGVTNMVLDALFVGAFGWGIPGAAWASVISQFVGGFVPLVYFIVKRDGVLYLGKACFDLRALGQTCGNGASEFMTNVSMSVVNMVYNWQLMRMLGENGVAAYGVIMYVGFVFLAIFIGYCIGSAPIVSFHYGAANTDELKNLFKKSLIMCAVCSIAMLTLSEVLARVVASIFTGYDEELLSVTTRAFRLYSISFLIAGFNIFASSFFTALNNGLVSAIISFSRVLLFQIVSVIVLPLIMGVDGIWLAIVAAELCSLAVSAAFFAAKRKIYQYA